MRELAVLILWPLELCFAAVEIVCDLCRWHLDRRPSIAEKVGACLDRERAIDSLVSQGWDMGDATTAVYGESRKAQAVAALVAQGWDKATARRIVGSMGKASGSRAKGLGAGAK